MTAQSNNPIHPFDAIASKFSGTEKNQSISTGSASTGEQDSRQRQESMPPQHPIAVETIKEPAMILSRDLHLLWQNQAIGDHIWRKIPFETYINSGSDIFDILFAPQFQNTVQNWRQWVAFFIQQALAMISVGELERLFSLKNDWQGESLLAMLTDFQPVSGPSTHSGYLTKVVNEQIENTFQVIGLNYAEGRLLVFEPVSHTSGANQKKIHQKHPTLQHPTVTHAIKHQTKVAASILYTRLNNAEILSNEMLSTDYGRLLFQLWELTQKTIVQYGGMFSQYEAAGLVGYFISTENEKKDAISVIQCALDLKNRAGELGRQWKIQTGWLHDIELNTGIHTGNEYFTSLFSSLGNNFIPLGKSLSTAAILSAIARDGQIWTTKEVIDQIAAKDLDILRFGIFRSDQARQIFIPRCFSRIRDLTNNHENTLLPHESSEKPVTQVFDYQA